MTDKELKTLKDNLWHAADVLRSGAHLAANKYGLRLGGGQRRRHILYTCHSRSLYGRGAGPAARRQKVP